MAARQSRLWLSNVCNHYEILGLDRTCTGKEIREAFVKLSKEVHPDRNPYDSSRHEQFVKLNEAYSVLSKPKTRQQYDLSLTSKGTSPFNDPYQMRSAASSHAGNNFYGTGFWHERNRSQDRYNMAKPYYGIKGLNKVPNWYIVVGCFMVILLGGTGHFIAIMYGNRISREVQDQKDRLYSSQYQEAKSQAKLYGNTVQLEMLKQRADAE